MTITNTKTEAISNAAQGLGALVWWTLSGTGIAPAALRGILANEGMDASIVPDVDPVAAIRRATREWSQGRGNADRFRAEVAAEGNGALTIGILTRTKPGAAEVRWMQVDSLAWDIATGGWCAQPLTGEGVAFQRFADDARTHLDHAWITPHLIQATLAKLDATSLRARGGIYYVPSQHNTALDRLARVVAQIGDSFLDVNTIAADSRTQQSIARAASASMTEDLAGLVARINAWSESARKVSTTSSASLIDELVALKNRADLYAEALNCGLGDLDTAIEAARVEAERVIGANVGTPRARSEGGAPKAPRADRVEVMRAMFDVNAVNGVATITPAIIIAAGMSATLASYAGVWTSRAHGGGTLLAAAGFKIVGMETETFTPENGKGTKYRKLVSMQIARGDAPKPDADSTVYADVLPEPDATKVESTDTIADGEAIEAATEPAGLALLDARQVLADDADADIVDLGDVDAQAAVDADVAQHVATVTTTEPDLREELANMTPAQVRERFVAVTGRSDKLSKALMIDAILAELGA